MGLFSSVFASANDKQVKKLAATADKIQALAQNFAAMSDSQLKDCTKQFRQRLAKGETLDSLLPEAFACVREASTRVLKMRHFRVQLMGGIALYEGRIAEMFTGEGKTLVATLPAYLSALEGKGVHIVTVNEYLARRDAEWMGKLYRFLGLSVGIIYSRQPKEEKREAYRCDITYGTNSEYGFDYLLDNMVKDEASLMQRGLHFAIIDEVDSILIDEARTPLIISGSDSNKSEGYIKAAAFAKTLNAPQADGETEEARAGDFTIDEEKNGISLTEWGIKKAEDFFSVNNITDDITIYRNIRFAIKAHFLMHRDVDYVVTDGEVIIVDEFTGRLMIGRRYNEGLHQAIEAKEGVQIRNESKTYASITFQNFFRLYTKISGMTGTAKTEETEFTEIYGADVICIPTNLPVIRQDEEDKIYLTAEAKLNAVVEEVCARHQKGQPVLVGTLSVEKSEQLSLRFNSVGLEHNILNAKNHKEEANVVAQAGRKGAITIATNMAGRGTDILLGGNPDYLAKQELEKQGFSQADIAEATSFVTELTPELKALHSQYEKLYLAFHEETEKNRQEVLEAGGLCIIGTEKHENRRIDNQLRGRSGRQGDPGSSVFFLSCEDDLIRINAGEGFSSYLASKHFSDTQPIQDKTVKSKVLQAQKYLEGRNFSTRKTVLAYDDVLNVHRELLYENRRTILFEKNVHEKVMSYFPIVVSEAVQQIVDYSDNFITWDYAKMNAYLESLFLPCGSNTITMGLAADQKIDNIIDAVLDKATTEYDNRVKQFNEANPQNDFYAIEKDILLSVIDSEWITHMEAMDDLRNSVGLRAIGQNDPLTCFRIDGRKMFDNLIEEIKRKSAMILLKLNIGLDQSDTAQLKTYPKDVLNFNGTDDNKEN